MYVYVLNLGLNCVYIHVHALKSVYFQFNDLSTKFTAQSELFLSAVSCDHV